jgi:uncharacterized cupin superfamily protein
MPNVFNAKSTAFEHKNSRIPEFAWRTSPNLAELVKSKYVAFDIRSLDPGAFSFPYHFHHGAEELFVILGGEATLRTKDGFQKVAEGDILFFEEGAEGAHQLYNHGDVPCVYLDLRTTLGVDVCEYPDSGKVGVFPKRAYFESASAVDYFVGEERPAEHWPQELLRKD